MALYKVRYRGKTRITYAEGALQTPGSMDNISINRFQYEHNNILPPGLTTLDGQKYMMPGWVKVNHYTTLADIKHIPPIKPVTKVEEFKFDSSSSNKVYVAKRYTKPDGEVKITCNCAGTWRAFDRRCIHIKSLEK
jgi:hypothetical protein